VGLDVGMVGEEGVTGSEENICEAVVRVREEENGVVSAYILHRKIEA
jgi:hypothetical protein